MTHTSRRQFIGLLGSAVSLPFAASLAQAQRDSRARRVGVLMNFAEKDPVTQRYLSPFRQGLAAAGWREGQNLTIDYRWDIRSEERAKANAAELLLNNPDVILSVGAVSLAALRNATASVPVVFVLVSDPVTLGYVSNLARPGGNITGFTTLEFSIGGKWIELLRELRPEHTHLAVLFAPQVNPYADALVEATRSVASKAAVSISSKPLRSASDIESVMASLPPLSSGIVVLQDAFTINHRKVIVEAASRHGILAIFPTPLYVADGGLISYGPDLFPQFGEAARYVSRILNGEKPGDLPVQQPTKFWLAVNLKAAKALGLEVPPTLLARADEVIE